MKELMMSKMTSENVMILGGYGGAGFNIAQILLQETGLNIILAGRNVIRADQVARQFNALFGGNRVRGMEVDAANAGSLHEAFQHCDTVVVCVPITASKIGGGVVQAAFDAGINCIDINLDTHKQQLLQELSAQIRDSGRYFLTEAGFMPGLPSMMAFLAAKRLDSVHSLQYGMLEKENNGGYGSAIDLLYYAADPAYLYQNGAWQKVSPTASRKIDFGPGFGKLTCYPMDLYELKHLPEELGSKEIGFYAAGMNPVTDLVLFFWVASGLYKFDWGLRMGAKLGIWTVNKFTKPPYTTTLVLEAGGTVNRHVETIKITISHNDGYQATAIPVVANILQLLDGTIAEPGVIISGQRVEPNRYVKDLKRMGMSVQIQAQGAE
jgi:saccharopine dehydrogenase (NAD+, L-lysine-forming)